MRNEQIYNRSPNFNQVQDTTANTKDVTSPHDKYSSIGSQYYYKTSRSDKDIELIEILNRKKTPRNIKSTKNIDSRKQSSKASNSQKMKESVDSYLHNETPEIVIEKSYRSLHKQKNVKRSQVLDTQKKNDDTGKGDYTQTYSSRGNPRMKANGGEKSASSFHSERKKERLKTEEFYSPRFSTTENYTDYFISSKNNDKDTPQEKNTIVTPKSDRYFSYGQTKKTPANESSELLQEINKFGSRIAKCNTEIDDLKKANESLTQENSMLKKSYGTIKSEMQNINKELDTSKIFNDEMVEKATQKIDYIDRLECDLMNQRKIHTNVLTYYKSFIEYVKDKAPSLGQGYAFSEKDFKITDNPMGFINEERKIKSMKFLKNLPDISQHMEEVDESLEQSAKFSTDTAEKEKDSIYVGPETINQKDIINIIDNEQYNLSEEKLIPNVDYGVQIDVFMDNLVANKQKEKKLIDNRFIDVGKGSVKKEDLKVNKVEKEGAKKSLKETSKLNAVVSPKSSFKDTQKSPRANQVREKNVKTKETPNDSQKSKEKVVENTKTVLTKKKSERNLTLSKDFKQPEEIIDTRQKTPDNKQIKNTLVMDNKQIEQNKKKFKEKLNEPERLSYKETKDSEPQRLSAKSAKVIEKVSSNKKYHSSKNITTKQAPSTNTKQKTDDSKKTFNNPKNSQKNHPFDFSKRDSSKQIKKPIFYNISPRIAKQYEFSDSENEESKRNSNSSKKQNSQSSNKSSSIERYKRERNLKLDTNFNEISKNQGICDKNLDTLYEEPREFAVSQEAEGFKSIDPHKFESIKESLKSSLTADNIVSPCWTQLKRMEKQNQDTINFGGFGLLKQQSMQPVNEDSGSEKNSPVVSPDRAKKSQNEVKQVYSRKKDSCDELVAHAKKNINILPSSPVLRGVMVETGDEKFRIEDCKDSRKKKEKPKSSEKSKNGGKQNNWGKRRLHNKNTSFKKSDIKYGEELTDGKYDY